MTDALRSALVSAAFGILAAQGAAAAPGDDFDICFKDSGDRAIEACTRAIDSGRYSGRNLAILYSNRGTEWFDKDDLDRALQDHSQAIRIDRTYASAWLNRGNVYATKGQRARAIDEYDEAIRLDPKNAKALNNRGDELRQMGEHMRALRDFDEAIRIEPSPVRYSNRCFARAIVGEAAGAVSDCNESLRTRPGNSIALSRRGFAYLKLGQLDKAIADFDAALDQIPRQSRSLFGRGIAKLWKGDRAGGEADIAAAKAIADDIAEEFVRYGVTADKPIRAAGPAPSSAPAADCGRAATHWKSTEQIKSLAVYEDHLARFPSCEFSALAKERIDALKK
jgi:tetratricopeptide (TPR) repeat protein